MTTARRQWAVQLSAAAEADLYSILRWSAERFGEMQAQRYANVLNSAIAALRIGPHLPGVKSRDDLASGIHFLHVARAGRKGRHVVVFRIAGEESIEVLRLLHDSMDFSRHIR